MLIASSALSISGDREAYGDPGIIAIPKRHFRLPITSGDSILFTAVYTMWAIRGMITRIVLHRVRMCVGWSSLIQLHEIQNLNLHDSTPEYNFALEPGNPRRS